MPGSRDAAQAIDTVKYREGYENIFGKRKSILDDAPVLPARKRKTFRRNSLSKIYFQNK